MKNIDVINYTNNTTLYIQRALSPARINSITVREEERRAEVFSHSRGKFPSPLGREEANIKLASMLTGYNIEVFRDIDEVDEEDYLS
jgi:N utilization substance protein A